MKLFKYNTTLYQFQPIISKILNVENLAKIHELELYELFTRGTDQSTKWHRLYYDNCNEFLDMYKKFVTDIIKPLYNRTIVYQKIPTFRVHLPNNIAVGEFHKDKDYRDKQWAKDVCELNYYLPLTNTNEFNTFWVESVEDKGDYSPAIVNYGEILEWDGANLKHGNYENKSTETRISVDFRIMPINRYKESDKGSINMKSQFKIGGYYDVL
jgi:hypothetical protein